MPSVIIEKKDRIGTITLNRPEVMNALDMELILELEKAVARMGKDEEINVVILKGAGFHFCSGADLNLLSADIDPEKWLLGMRHLGAIMTGLREIPQPVITALRGVAVGGGANLASSLWRSINAPVHRRVRRAAGTVVGGSRLVAQHLPLEPGPAGSVRRGHGQPAGVGRVATL